ncbi:penicillin-binding protein 1 [Streptomyces sp. NBRC 110611]|nr:penicillin-binding protein 1 [Streptomyces sp. NBRC 110611]
MPERTPDLYAPDMELHKEIPNRPPADPGEPESACEWPVAPDRLGHTCGMTYVMTCAMTCVVTVRNECGGAGLPG